MSEEIQAPLPRLLQPGIRKVTVLGGTMASMLIVACVALFIGKMDAPQWSSMVLEVLKWAGGIFAVSNVLEHGLKATAKALGK